MIHVTNRQRDLPLSKPSVRAVVSAFLALHEVVWDEVGVHFVREREICRLHALYFDDPSPTDCITLPIATGGAERLLGDLFIAPSAALAYVARRGGDPYEETLLYLVHGLLHLLGYDDVDPKERRKMRQKERHALEMLKKMGLSLYGSPRKKE